jgi:hypothetical protein
MVYKCAHASAYTCVQRYYNDSLYFRTRNHRLSSCSSNTSSDEKPPSSTSRRRATGTEKPSVPRPAPPGADSEQLMHRHSEKPKLVAAPGDLILSRSVCWVWLCVCVCVAVCVCCVCVCVCLCVFVVCVCLSFVCMCDTQTLDGHSGPSKQLSCATDWPTHSRHW